MTTTELSKFVDPCDIDRQFWIFDKDNEKIIVIVVVANADGRLFLYMQFSRIT